MERKKRTCAQKYCFVIVVQEEIKAVRTEGLPLQMDMMVPCKNLTLILRGQQLKRKSVSAVCYTAGRIGTNV